MANVYKRLETEGIARDKVTHCKNWGVKMTPVGVNRGPHPQVLKLHPNMMNKKLHTVKTGVLK